MKSKLAPPAKLLQDFLTSFLARNPSEELKSEITLASDEVSKLLASLPEPQQDTESEELKAAIGFMSAQKSALDTLQKALHSAEESTKTVKDSIPAEVQKALNAEVDKGELIKKADMQAKIDVALNAAKTEWENAIKLVGERRVALNAAKVPVPADALLTAKEEDYKAKFDVAKARSEKIANLKFEDADRVALCWEAEEKYFNLAIKNSEPEKKSAPNGFVPGASTETKVVRLFC